MDYNAYGNTASFTYSDLTTRTTELDSAFSISTNTQGITSFPLSPTTTGGAIPAAETISKSFLKINNSKAIVCDFPLPINLAQNSVSTTAWTEGKFKFKYYFWFYLTQAEKDALDSKLEIYLCNDACTAATKQFSTNFSKIGLSTNFNTYLKGTYLQEYITVEYVATDQVKVYINDQSGNGVIIHLNVFLGNEEL